MDCDCHDHHTTRNHDAHLATGVSLVISFQRRLFDLEDVDPVSTTVIQVKEMVADWSGIPVEGQKLLHKGRVLQNDAKLADVGLVAPVCSTSNISAEPTAYKLMLMGSSLADVRKIQNMRVHRPAKPATHIPAARPRAGPRDLASLSLEGRYTFHEIAVLSLPQSDQARAILERLRDDHGICGIMQQNQWSVGRLIELSPTEHTILGYNQNKGQTIALRLRTNDFSGFRHFDSIRKVLLHELAHMVWSEHDERFHALNRKLNKDLVALDWTRRGNRLNEEVSSVSVFGHSIFDEEDDDEHVDSGGYVGGSFVLGGGRDKTMGDGEEEEEEQGLSARERAVRAALARVTGNTAKDREAAPSKDEKS